MTVAQANLPFGDAPDPGKIPDPVIVASDMAHVVRAVERALRQGDTETPPAVDAERLHAVMVRHRVPAAALEAAIVDIRGNRPVEDPIGRAVYRVLGDPGADVLTEVLRLLGA